MNGNSFRTLEFDAVKALVLSYAGSAAGQRRLHHLTPATDVAEVRRRLLRTREALALVRTLGRQPYHDLPDVSEPLAAARVEGVDLEPRQLLDVASFVEGGMEIARAVARCEAAPGLARRASEVPVLDDVASAIRRAILPSGEVSDDASPRLAEVRRALTRLRAQLTTVMESLLRGKEAERALQDKLITTRNERYVLLVKAEQRGQVPGIIHGSSGSGASLFVEPLPAVELNNDIVSLGDQERAEVQRILRELTSRVGDRAADLGLALDVLGELDAAQAMALTARDMDATEPEIWEEAAGNEDQALELKDARHPLLMPAICERLGLARRSTREPVPVTLRVGFGAPVLVISGPNTGGKTVALKTAGLLSLMAQCGLFVPAGQGSVLPVFRRVYADIGDEQSIEANLSTFSAHLATIVEMTKGLELPALVLLDEAGAGTDPTEGGALGVAIVDYFRSRGAMVMATTHHGLLKAYAQSTPGVGSASFGYDPGTYEPTYRLALGVAGRSMALEMAERLGLPPAVVRDARARRDDKEAQAEALLEKLEEDRSALAAERERIAAERAAVEAARHQVAAAESAVEARKRAELDAFKRELQRRGEEAARKATEAVAQAVRRLEAAPRLTPAATARARSQAVGAIREAQQEALSLPGLALAEPSPPETALAVGGRARLRTLGVVGEIMALPAKGDAEVAVGGKRLRVPRSELLGVAGPAQASRAAFRPSPAGARDTGGANAFEVNVVGLTTDEAVPKVDKALDQAVMAERGVVRVIHGFGSGALRRAVATLLHDHPHVASFRAGGAREGGGGVTVVELKE
ncbi:MAG TPA: Smr/MutS family protein [Vicinamibacteria bacterium]|nr:Smr/MutS family protein [Vicinamibacteria bacterium]